MLASGVFYERNAGWMRAVYETCMHVVDNVRACSLHAFLVGHPLNRRKIRTTSLCCLAMLQDANHPVYHAGDFDAAIAHTNLSSAVSTCPTLRSIMDSLYELGPREGQTSGLPSCHTHYSSYIFSQSNKPSCLAMTAVSQLFKTLPEEQLYSKTRYKPFNQKCSYQCISALLILTGFYFCSTVFWWSIKSGERTAPIAMYAMIFCCNDIRYSPVTSSWAY